MYNQFNSLIYAKIDSNNEMTCKKAAGDTTCMIFVGYEMGRIVKIFQNINILIILNMIKVKHVLKVLF